METGFTIIKYPTEPSEEETVSVINAFELACFRDITGSEGSTIHCKGGRESESYWRAGLDDRVSSLLDCLSLAYYVQWLENFVEREFRENYDWIFEQDPIILRGSSGTITNEPKVAHPSENAISILRLIKGEIAPSRGQLKLFGVSHHGTWQVEHRLTNRHLLVMKGLLKWTLQPPEDTTLIWKGFSKRPMLGDV